MTDVYQAERITLNDLFDKYIKSKPEIRDSTRNNYVYMYNRYVRDTIGLQTISTFRYTMIVEFYKSLIFEMNISAETVEIIHTVLLWTGLRIGEFIGLTWDDCSFERNEISVNHSLLYRQAEDGKCGYTIHDTKTEKGAKAIPMLEPVRTALLKEKER